MKPYGPHRLRELRSLRSSGPSAAVGRICGLGPNLHGIVTAPPPEPARGQECYAHRIEAWLHYGGDSHDQPERRVGAPQNNANQEKPPHQVGGGQRHPEAYVPIPDAVNM